MCFDGMFKCSTVIVMKRIF